MKINEEILKNDEKAVFNLRDIYKRYGYSHYRMNRFEEYDLYSKNKDFLISDSVITFTDATGKLMALKPDVTLSIIKNTQDIQRQVQKFYYNENVYRVSKGSHDFKEIVQAGLECIGDIDIYNLSEVIFLAAKSLETISEDYILDISHISFVEGLLDETSATDAEKESALKALREKNAHELQAVLKDDADKLVTLSQAYGDMKSVIEKLKAIDVNEKTHLALLELEEIYMLFKRTGMDSKIRLDFSGINDINYYNGIVFQGFINGISSCILSGGQYDKLMRRMNKKSGAIGFAVYLDLLQRYNEAEPEFDYDILIIYSEDDDYGSLMKAVSSFIDEGNTVLAQKSVPNGIKCKRIISLSEVK